MKIPGAPSFTLRDFLEHILPPVNAAVASQTASAPIQAQSHGCREMVPRAIIALPPSG